MKTDVKTIQFQEIPIGGYFEFRGRRYRKLALSLASDEERNGNIFQPQTEVLQDPFAPPQAPAKPAVVRAARPADPAGARPAVSRPLTTPAETVRCSARNNSGCHTQVML